MGLKTIENRELLNKFPNPDIEMRIGCSLIKMWIDYLLAPYLSTLDQN